MTKHRSNQPCWQWEPFGRVGNWRSSNVDKYNLEYFDAVDMLLTGRKNGLADS